MAPFFCATLYATFVWPVNTSRSSTRKTDYTSCHHIHPLKRYCNCSRGSVRRHPSLRLIPQRSFTSWDVTMMTSRMTRGRRVAERVLRVVPAADLSHFCVFALTASGIYTGLLCLRYTGLLKNLWTTADVETNSKTQTLNNLDTVSRH